MNIPKISTIKEALDWLYFIVLTLIRTMPNPNLLINGCLRIWQRGTSFTNPANAYTADRLKCTGTGTVSKVADGMKITGTINVRYIMEDTDYKPIEGKTVTLSYSKDGIVITDIYQSDRYNAVTGGRVVINLDLADCTIEWIKLELGDKATPFVPRPYADEIRLCQRYYQIAAVRERSNTYGLDLLTFSVRPIVPTRITPTMDFNALGVWNTAAFPESGFTLSASNYHTSTAFGIVANKIAHGLVNEGFLYGNISADAEL